MNDENVISRLRTAETGDSQPTQADVTAAAARGLRMRRRRHALAGVATASALSLAAVLAMVVVPSDGSTVFQEAAPAVGTDAGPGPDAANWRLAPEKFRILLEALGVDPRTVGDWGMVVSEREGTSLRLDMDSPSARGVPAGDTVRIEIGAEHKPYLKELGCPPPGATTNPSELAPASGERTVRIIRAKSGARVEPEMTETDKAFATNYFTFVREDDLEVSIRLIVRSPRTVETDARQDRAQSWMAQLDDELITAATDPRIDADPKSASNEGRAYPGIAVATPNPRAPGANQEPPAAEDDIREEFARHNRNMQRLRAALGEGWELEYTDKPGVPVAATIHLKGDAATASGLPKGAYVWASIGVSTAPGPPPSARSRPAGA